MEALETDKDISIKNENENNSELLIGNPNLNDHEHEVSYEKKDDVDVSMRFNDQDKLDVPSLVEICKQQLIVILKDMCADSNNSDEKASFMYHLNRLRSAVTVVDLHNYIAVFGPCLSYNKLPSTWNISVCDYLKQQLNILRAADSQQNSNNYMNYYELHNDFDEVINEKKINNINNSIQGNINSNNINSQSSMKGTLHVNCTNNMNYSFCNQDDKIVDDYYECLMRTKLSEESSDCLKYMVNTKNEPLSNTEVENVMSYLKKYEIKSVKNSNKIEENMKYNKDFDFDYQEEYLKDKALYDSDIDEQQQIENSMHNNFNTNDNLGNNNNENNNNNYYYYANNNNNNNKNHTSNNNNNNNNHTTANNNNNNDNNNNNSNNNNNNNNNSNNNNNNDKNINLKSERMKRNDINNWTKANTEGHPEYLPRIPGVRFNPKKQQWLAAWNDNTREIRRYFSVKQYGFDQARILAVKARQEAEKAGARCKPMFHVHGRKTIDTLSNELIKNDIEENYNNALGNNTMGNDLLNKKESIKSENKGLKRGRGRPPKRKLSEDSQLSLDDIEQNICRNNDNIELLECMESLDKDCTRPMKGVSYNDRKGSWLAYWSIGKNFQMKRFPIKKLGFEKAKELAIQCRLEAEQAGATTTENRTKRMRNLLNLNFDNALDQMMEHNSMENDENLSDKNVNENILVSQIQNFNNTAMNNNIQPTKIPNSDEHESEIDFSPTKRTRAPRGRRMESLTARASALTPVEGVRFDPYSYSWFAKYLENENSKKPKISKYLLKKWGFNKAHSLAVHTVKCSYKAVPFTNEELINIFNVDMKNFMNNQNNLINLGYNETFNNMNNNFNNMNNNINNSNFNIINNNNNNNIMSNMNIMNNSINNNIDNNISNNYNNNNYNSNTKSVSNITNNMNNDIDKNTDNMNINNNNSNNKSDINSHNNRNNNNNNTCSNNNDLNVNVSNNMNILNNYNFKNNGNINNDNTNNYNNDNNNIPKSGNAISNNLISNNLNNNLKTNIGNNNMNNFMSGYNISNNNYCSNEIIDNDILDEKHKSMANVGNKVDNNSNNSSSLNIIEKKNTGNHMNMNEYILNKKVNDFHNQNNKRKMNIHIGNLASSNPIDNVINSHINDISLNHTNDHNFVSVDNNYNISSNKNNSNINSEKAINNKSININNNDINNENQCSLNNIENSMDNRNLLNIINEHNNLDNNTNIDNNNSYSNNHYSQNSNIHFNSYNNENSNSNNLISSNKNKNNDSSLYYMNVKPEIKTEQ